MISVVINTKNEERWIAQAISSVQGFADEILVADMASTDRTVPIAESLGARVITVPDYGFVEPARRQAVDASHGDWILLLDADEVVPPSLASRFQSIAADPSIDAAIGSHANYMFGRRVAYTGWGLSQDRHLRFFRRSRVVLPDDIHGLIRVRDGANVTEIEPVEELSIVHFNYVDWSQFLQKLDRYTTIEAQSWVDQKRTLKSRRMVWDVLREIKWRFFSGGGWREGYVGFGLTVMMVTYRVSTYVKARQLKEQGTASEIVDSYRHLAAGFLEEDRRPSTGA